MAVNISYTVSYASMSLASTRASTLDAVVIGGGLGWQLVGPRLTELTGVTQAMASSIVAPPPPQAPVSPPEARYSVHITTTLHGYNTLTFGVNEQDAFVEAIAILGKCETTDVQVVRVIYSSAQLQAVGTWEAHSVDARVSDSVSLVCLKPMHPPSKSIIDKIVYRNVSI
jgi:hypothetical protein